MADFPAPGPAPLVFDLHQVSRKQYSDFRLGRMTDDGDNALLARVTGLSVAEVEAMPLLEFRRMVQAFFKKATEPLADPNSASASSTA